MMVSLRYRMSMLTVEKMEKGERIGIGVNCRMGMAEKQDERATVSISL